MTKDTFAEDIRQEPLIKKRWEFMPSSPDASPDGILITGANSFIGTHVIGLLQQRWEGTIHLLLRAATQREAIAKMRQAFRQWELGEFYAENFSIHTGDVTHPMMGLDTPAYHALLKDTGTVLHLAINPMFSLPYAHFKRLWLPGLERMIAFCGDKKYPKSLHYPSTLSTGFFSEEDDFRRLDTNALLSGHTAFKWVAGMVLQNAFSRGLRGCLYEIPAVLGMLEKGLCPAHYYMWHVMDIFLKTGLYTDFAFRVIPVDVLAEIMVANLIQDKQGKGSRFLRPAPETPVTHKQFGHTIASILGLRHATPEELREAYTNKRQFDFIIPPGFNSLLGRVNAVPAVWPPGFNKQNLPPAAMAFLSNLNRTLAHTNMQKTVNTSTN
jgi:hypothetical protein